MPTDGQRVSETAKCKQVHAGYRCTLAKGHDGRHESHWFGKVTNAWPAEPVAVPPASPVTCECCGRTKADHVRYSNFGDIPFCGHPAYGLRVFTEPPAPTEIPADLKADYRDCVNWHNGSYIKGLIDRIAALEGKRA